MHDAFSKTIFHVKVGQTLYLTITNKDTVPRGISSPDAGVNITVQPGTHTYTVAVNKVGTFTWFCPYPCGTFSMSHVGYMQGRIIVSPP